MEVNLNRFTQVDESNSLPAHSLPYEDYPATWAWKKSTMNNHDTLSHIIPFSVLFSLPLFSCLHVSLPLIFLPLSLWNPFFSPQKPFIFIMTFTPPCITCLFYLYEDSSMNRAKLIAPIASFASYFSTFYTTLNTHIVLKLTSNIALIVDIQWNMKWRSTRLKCTFNQVESVHSY